MIFKSVCYLSDDMTSNRFIIVLLLMLFIDLEVNLVFANKSNYRYSNQSNISLGREKRQVLFGGKYLIRHILIAYFSHLISFGLKFTIFS